MSLPSFGLWRDRSDEALKAAFDNLDTDKRGKLCRSEMVKALKTLGRSDAEVKEELSRSRRFSLSFEEFKVMAKPPKAANPIHDVPLFGAFTAAFSDRAFGTSEEDLKEAFA